MERQGPSFAGEDGRQTSRLRILAPVQAEPIAVVGLGCRFPRAPDAESFWSLLEQGIDAITEVPPDRWDANELYDPRSRTPGKMSTKWGGFLDDVHGFDPIFFRVMPIEAARIDPQHRLVMEVAWEALESAGIDPTGLAYSKTGVFIGLSHSDHDRLLYQDRARIDGYNGPNTYHCFAANRLSFFLNVRGPSLAVDTACSSALVAIHLACQSLRSGESDLALAGGVNLNLTPEEFIALSFLGVMAADGRCKTFDARADGFVRGEGCGVLALKRLGDAEAGGDNIVGLIRGSAVNQDGLSNGITAPNGAAQEEVLRSALQNAGVDANEVSFVEVQGTGTALGDPIEMTALKNVYANGRDPGEPCLLGCVKTNIGHLEAASGVAGVAKTLLAFQHGRIPPNLHFQRLNRRITLNDTPFLIPTESHPWAAGRARRVAAVSAFGFGGTNAHVILEEPPERPEAPASEPEAGTHVLTLSAKSEAALAELARRYETALKSGPQSALADICYTSNVGRAHFHHRLAVVASSRDELRSRLALFNASGATGGVYQGRASRNRAPDEGSSAGNDASPEDLAQAYAGGARVDWTAVHRERPRRRVPLPTYPFERQICRFTP